ncbi:MAG: VOC family protein [Saprospiraceae bacterium]|nr:VOC family protein [Saprospiraceae bacterium]
MDSNKKQNMINAINWFEIPVTDFGRAKKFYETLFDAEIMEMPFPGGKYGMLPCDMQKGVGGGIVQGEGFTPSDTGSIVYLNGGDDLNIPLGRIEQAGAKILLPKTSIGENGFMAHFIDTEGNRVALHSMS